jgi:hypothetical protein
MEHTLLLLLSNYIVSSKRTSGNWFLHYFPIFFLTLPKNRKKSNNIYHHKLYPPNWLYPLILVLSLATIIAISNWNYLLLFSPRKPNNPRIYNYTHLNHHHECQRTCIRSTKHDNKDKHHFFAIYLTCSTFFRSKFRIKSELAPA